MKILIAVMSAEAYLYNGMDCLIRDTWAQKVPHGTFFRFFCGRGETVLPGDYVRVDAPDDKDNLSYKVEEICRWALEHGYQRMLKVDIDTFVNIEEMSKLDISGDWIGAPIGMLGQMYGNTGAWAWVQGSAMWLSEWSMEIIRDEMIDTMEDMQPQLMKANGIISPYPHSEDLWIGQVLRNRVRAVENKGFSNGPLTYHFAICHSTCTQDEWRARLEKWFHELHEGNYEYHGSR